jgi:hypothetical protein
MRIMGTNQKTNLANSSNMGPLAQVSGFTLSLYSPAIIRKGQIIYLLVATLIHYLERLIDFWRQAGGLVAGNEKLLAEIVWPHFWAIQIILFVLIVIYCTMHELVHVIGRKKVLRIFFGPMPILSDALMAEAKKAAVLEPQD